jgi:hypothetical protein
MIDTGAPSDITSSATDTSMVDSLTLHDPAGETRTRLFSRLNDLHTHAMRLGFGIADVDAEGVICDQFIEMIDAPDKYIHVCEEDLAQGAVLPDTEWFGFAAITLLSQRATATTSADTTELVPCRKVMATEGR